MATSKLKAIKKTLDKAITYIIDPEKTEGGSLVSSFGCGVGTADIQMQMTAQKGSGLGDRIAYHLMQSFSPDDNITPEKAHELGREFAQKVLKGKFEFVIATHVDKEHIHNHIIFNAVSFHGKHNKYHTGDWETEKKRIRRINDKICRENNLSVIENTSGRKGYEPYERKGKTKKRSWKDLLRKDIDDAVRSAKSFDEFIQIMELEKNYIAARRGSFLRLHPPGYDEGSYFRLSEETLGEAYTEEAIRERIGHPEESALKYKTVISKGDGKTAGLTNETKPKSPEANKRYVYKPNPDKINSIIDISKNAKAKESLQYSQALVRANINTFTKSMNFFIKHNLNTPEEISDYYNAASSEYVRMHESIKSKESKLIGHSEKIKLLQDYKKYHNLYYAAMRAGAKTDFYMSHTNEIVLFEASKMYFEQRGENPDELNLSDLFTEYKELKKDKLAESDTYYKLKNELKELEVIMQNIETTLDIKLVHKEDEAARAREQEEKEAVRRQQDKEKKSGDIGY